MNFHSVFTPQSFPNGPTDFLFSNGEQRRGAILDNKFFCDFWPDDGGPVLGWKPVAPSIVTIKRFVFVSQDLNRVYFLRNCKVGAIGQLVFELADRTPQNPRFE